MASTLPHPHLHANAAPQLAERACNTKLKLLRLPRPSATRVIHVPAFMRYWHLASLDAPSVAVVWSLAFAWAAHMRLPTWVLPLEALTVWAFYVGDRLFDARHGLRYDGEGMRERHWFHWNHRRVLAPMAIAAIAGAACIALRWMPALTWGRDSVIGLASLAYFTRVHSGRLRAQIFSKEMLVGTLFATGCALPAISWAAAAPLIFFAALAWLNCSAIEHWESASQETCTAKTAAYLALAASSAAVLLIAFQPRASILLIAGAASAMLLAALDHLRPRMTPLTLRAGADLALLTPAIALAAVWRLH